MLRTDHFRSLLPNDRDVGVVISDMPDDEGEVEVRWTCKTTSQYGRHLQTKYEPVGFLAVPVDEVRVQWENSNMDDEQWYHASELYTPPTSQTKLFQTALLESKKGVALMRHAVRKGLRVKRSEQGLREMIVHSNHAYSGTGTIESDGPDSRNQVCVTWDNPPPNKLTGSELYDVTTHLIYADVDDANTHASVLRSHREMCNAVGPLHYAFKQFKVRRSPDCTTGFDLTEVGIIVAGKDAACDTHEAAGTQPFPSPGKTAALRVAWFPFDGNAAAQSGSDGVVAKEIGGEIKLVNRDGNPVEIIIEDTSTEQADAANTKMDIVSIADRDGTILSSPTNFKVKILIKDRDLEEEAGSIAVSEWYSLVDLHPASAHDASMLKSIDNELSESKPVLPGTAFKGLRVKLSPDAARQLGYTNCDPTNLIGRITSEAPDANGVASVVWGDDGVSSETFHVVNRGLVFAAARDHDAAVQSMKDCQDTFEKHGALTCAYESLQVRPAPTYHGLNVTAFGTVVSGQGAIADELPTVPHARVKGFMVRLAPSSAHAKDMDAKLIQRVGMIVCNADANAFVRVNWNCQEDYDADSKSTFYSLRDDLILPPRGIRVTWHRVGWKAGTGQLIRNYTVAPALQHCAKIVI